MHARKEEKEATCARRALEKELEQQKAERQQLLEVLQEKQDEIVQFREERLSLQENNSR